MLDMYLKLIIVEIDFLKPTSNLHATKIMRKIRSKLEGVDFGVQHKMSVNEQVSTLQS